MRGVWRPTRECIHAAFAFRKSWAVRVVWFSPEIDIRKLHTRVKPFTCFPSRSHRRCSCAPQDTKNAAVHDCRTLLIKSRTGECCYFERPDQDFCEVMTKINFLYRLASEPKISRAAIAALCPPMALTPPPRRELDPAMRAPGILELTPQRCAGECSGA